MNYLYDIWGRFAGTSDTPTARSTTVAPPEQSADWNWTDTEWVFAPGVLTEPVAPTGPTAPPEPAPTTLTRIGFRNRFTEAEKQAIYTAAETVVAVRVYLDDVMAAEEVDLTNPNTIAGVNALEASGLLAEGRAAEILTP